VHQTQVKNEQRGVLLVCMCPTVALSVPAATWRMVVSSMSPSRRDSRYASSGIVAAVGFRIWTCAARGPGEDLRLQQQIEQRACQLLALNAPAQLLGTTF
jgi:uncharacterized FAD-dependent dehydrogenase